MPANYRFQNGEIQVQLTDGRWMHSGHDATTWEEVLLHKNYFQAKPLLMRAFEQKFATDDPNGRR